MEPFPPRAFFQRWRDLRGEEQSRIGASVQIRVPLAGLVREDPNLALSIRSGIGRVLRFVGRLALFGPVLLLPKLLLPRFYSDHITVAFVLLVVLFFAVLNAYLLASFVWWIVRNRSGGLSFAEPEETDAEQLARPHVAGSLTGKRVRATGRVVALGGSDVVVRMLTSQDGMWRLSEIADFAVIPKEGMPIVARVLAAPVVRAEQTIRSLQDAGFANETLALAGEESGDGVAIRIENGDEIEIIGVAARVVDNADHFDLDGNMRSIPRASDDDPYRRAPGGPALILGSDDDPRIFLRSAR